MVRGRSAARQRDVGIEVGACGCNLANHIAVDAAIEKVGEILQVEVAIKRRIKVKKVDAIEITNIPDEAARLFLECVLLEDQNLRELTNAFDVVLAFLRLHAPLGPLKVSEPLALRVKVVQPPPNRIDRPLMQHISQPLRPGRYLLLRRPSNRMCDRNWVVKHECSVRESVVVRGRAAANVDGNVAQIDALDCCISARGLRDFLGWQTAF